MHMSLWRHQSEKTKGGPGQSESALSKPPCTQVSCRYESIQEIRTWRACMRVCGQGGATDLTVLGTQYVQRTVLSISKKRRR